MPLAVGRDLSFKDKGRFDRHLATCKNCQERYSDLKNSLDLAKSLFQRDKGLDWKETEWEQLLEHVVTQKRKIESSALIKFPRWAWAVSAGFLFLLALGSGFLFKKQPSHPQEIIQLAQLPSQALPKSSTVPTPIPETRVQAGQKSVVKKIPSMKPVKPNPAVMNEKAKVPIPLGQSVSALVFVSQDTQLTVHWYVNKDFNYKEGQK
jgi:hypothetical protein